MAATPAKKTPAVSNKPSTLSDLLGNKTEDSSVSKSDSVHDHDDTVDTSREHSHVNVNKTEATKEPKNDVPDHLTSDVDKKHNYGDLNKDETDDTVDSKTGAKEDNIVPVSQSNAVHTGITDNYPNDFAVPEDYPPNESALTQRTVTERYYAAPNPHDDKFDPSVMHRIKDVDENQDDSALNADTLRENEVETKMEKIQDADSKSVSELESKSDDNDKNAKPESK